MNKHYLILYVDDEREMVDEWESDGNKLALILCDHIMPGTLGVNFLVELNQRATTRASRKLLLTGQAGLEATVEVVNHGGLHYYLAKPWRLETLQEAVREQLTDYLLAEDNENAFHYAPLLNQARLFAAIHDHPFDE